MPSLETVEVPIEQDDDVVVVVVDAAPSVTAEMDSNKRKITPATEPPPKKKKSNQMTLGAFLSKTRSTSPLLNNHTTKRQKDSQKETSAATFQKRAALRDIVMGRPKRESTDACLKLVDKFETSESKSLDSSKDKNDNASQSDAAFDDAVMEEGDTNTKDERQDKPESSCDKDPESVAKEDAKQPRSSTESKSPKIASQAAQTKMPASKKSKDNNETSQTNGETASKPDDTMEEATTGDANAKDERHDKAESSADKDVDQVSMANEDAKEQQSSSTESKSPKIASKAERTKTPTTKTKKTDSDQEALMANLPDESKNLLKKHETMRENYSRRANELLERCQNGLEEEKFSIALPQQADLPADASFDPFPDFCVKILASMVEGSQLALTLLAETATSSLNQIYQTQSFTTESITAKIKLLATRKCYMKNPGIASGQVQKPNANIFEDNTVEHMWRWEVTVLELLPDDVRSKVKKARSARKKLAFQFNAVAKLLSSLKDADKLIVEEDNTNNETKLDKILAKISQEEEKVLKFEREEEKSRLALEAKQKEEAAKAAEKRKKEMEQEEKAKEKQRLLEEARKEKERKKQEAAEEKQRKKLEAAEEKQRKKQEAAELKEKKAKAIEEKQRKEQAQKQMQKNVMMSFLSAKPAAKPKAVAAPTEKPKPETTIKPAAALDGFDVTVFRSKIGTATKSRRLFEPQTTRKRRAKQVTLSVFVTVMPDDDAFGARPFAEQQDVTVRNKYKFLRFHEDVRPPYHGTWSKTSSVVTGRTPFGKDHEMLDYDNDSEAEWEEGDDEFGEDLDNEGDDEEEKDDEDAEDDEDGWLAADDEIEEELDEETKRLRQKHRENYSEEKRIENKVSLIAPDNGVPVTWERLNQVNGDREPAMEGFEVQEGYDLLNSHSVKEVQDYDLYLDAFPPALIDEPQDQTPSDGKTTNGQEMTTDDMKSFARFVHQCTIGSKEKVVEELRSTHPTITSSRAQAFRVLESIANKHKHPVKGAIWQVKREILAQLGLNDLIDAASADASDAKQQALKTIATFVHHCTFTSKEKVLDELRCKHESVLPSRAETTRILESMAEKKKHPSDGVYWEVKASVRDELGLHELAQSPPKAIKDDATKNDTTTTTITPAAKAKSKQSSSVEKTPASADDASSSCGKKRKTPSPNDHGTKRNGSAKLLQAFLKKRS